jgi:hypothetical protein
MRARDRMALIVIAQALADHLTECEAKENNIRIDPAPSAHVLDAINTLSHCSRMRADLENRAVARDDWGPNDEEHEDNYQ